MDKPKYAIVQQWIKNQIDNGIYKNGDKILSENELMNKFNFSRQTIRLAISNLENQGCLKKIKGSGTYVDIKLNKKLTPSRNIGVIITYLDSYIFPDIIKGIETVLTKNNYNITLGITYNNIKKETILLNSMLTKKIDGLIIEGCKTALLNPNIEIYKNISKKIPCLFIHGKYSGINNVSSILMDDIEGGFKSTNYLIEMGHRNITAIFKSDDIQGHKRYEGYIKAMQKTNIYINDNNILWYTTEDLENTFDTLLEKSFKKQLLNSTAVVCYNDEIALKVIEFLKTKSLKPFDDISIISFDNSKIAELLNITSINHLKTEFGIKAAKVLINQIKTGEISEVKIKSNLIIRQSVKNNLKTI